MNDQPAIFKRAFDLDDNRLLPLLFGESNCHLFMIETTMKVSIGTRGNHISISGGEAAVNKAETILRALYAQAEKGQDIQEDDVLAALRMVGDNDAEDDFKLEPERVIQTWKKTIQARTSGQKQYLKALEKNELVFGLGPAGTGKTYLAVAMGVSMLKNGKVERLILSRPAVEAGERLGFLPGDLRDKIDPYLRPLYDALYDMMPPEQVERRLAAGEIEVAPLAFMRGRTLANAFVILDEAQNTTPTQMKMFLTRLGNHSRMVITGDLTQIDLPKGTESGLPDALYTLKDIDGISFVHFNEKDIVRHALVNRIVLAYNAKARLGKAL